jgi:Polysaccharide lyase family 4, domain III
MTPRFDSAIANTALYRDAVTTGQYQTYVLQFDPSLLQVGPNTVSIAVRKTGSSTWSGTRPVLPAYGIMYDCVQLEAGPAVQ